LPSSPLPRAAAPRSFFERHRQRIRDTLRMTVSTAITFALAAAFDLTQGFWAVIAALIVTQSSLGSSLKAALEQLTGSILGAVYGAAIVLVVPHHGPVLMGVALVIAVAPLAVLATISPGFRIAPITAIIVLLSSIGITLGPVAFAVERILEIALGCTIGLAVSVLIMPAHAYESLLQVAGRVSAQIAEQIELLSVVPLPPGVNVGALPTEIRKGLATLESLADEASRERRSRLSDEPDPEPLARTLARLHTDVAALGRVAARPLPAQVHEVLAGPWSGVMNAAATLLHRIGTALPQRDGPGSLEPVREAIAAYETAVREVRRSGLTRTLPNDAAGRVFALGFVLDQFRRNLADLVARVREVETST
jgi:hypothetical protein